MTRNLLMLFRKHIKKAANADDHNELDQLFLNFEANIYNRALRDVEKNVSGSSGINSLKKTLKEMQITPKIIGNTKKFTPNVIPFRKK